MHALRAELARERLRDAALGKLAGGKGGELGGAADRRGGAGDDEGGRMGRRRGGADGGEELGEGALGEEEEAVAGCVSDGHVRSERLKTVFERSEDSKNVERDNDSKERFERSEDLKTYAAVPRLLSRSSGVNSRNGLNAKPALALYTAAASLASGHVSAILSNAASTEDLSEASAVMPMALPPALVTASTTGAKLASLRASRATGYCLAKSCATEAPVPEPTPAMTA